ncbi:MAG: DMT family transporter [Propionibacteriaceae bacterium]|nr:DMT family transporter [Propionibacteriaceae bacterium]
MLVVMVLGVIAGTALPLQTNVNTRLRQTVGSPFLATFLSFSIGTLSLLVATLVMDGRLPGPSAAAGTPAWLWIGGVFGIIVLTANLFMFPRLGAVQTAVLPVTGQVLMGLLIDHFGWFRTEQVDLGLTRGLGGLLVLVGVFGAIGAADRVFGRAGGAPTGSSHGASAWLWRLVGIGCGALMASQTAINGRLGVALGSAIAATLISFAVGVVALLIILLVTRTPWRWLRVDERPNPWWMWTGGVLGAAFVFANALLQPILGTGLTVMLILLGMMLGSLAIDALGLLGARRKRVTLFQAIGLVLMIAGVGLIRLV